MALMKIRFAVSTGILDANPAAFAEEVQAMEAIGFDTVWLSDLPLGATLDPIVGLSFAAAATSTLRVQTHILVLPYRNPFLVARNHVHHRDHGTRAVLDQRPSPLRDECWVLGHLHRALGSLQV